MILRDLKLDILLGNQNPIIDKFNEITKGLKVINTEVYEDHGQEFIFYNQNRQWVFFQDLKNNYFWCNYDLYWSIFEYGFNTKYKEIQEITKYMVEETLKIKVNSYIYINSFEEDAQLLVENLKSKVHWDPVTANYHNSIDNI